MFTTLKPRDAVEGSGMGLALVKKIVEGRSGTIRLESAEGRGATFRFTWPDPRRVDAWSDTVSIMIVDDDEVDVRAIRAD